MDTAHGLRLTAYGLRRKAYSGRRKKNGVGLGEPNLTPRDT
jgi:hypothetical protein